VSLLTRNWPATLLVPGTIGVYETKLGEVSLTQENRRAAKREEKKEHWDERRTLWSPLGLLKNWGLLFGGARGGDLRQ